MLNVKNNNQTVDSKNKNFVLIIFNNISKINWVLQK